TVPSLLGLEKQTNPFLRPDSVALQETLGLVHSDSVTVFAQTRRLKDSF
ncbi:MAG: hydroxyacylglutathione hydrolase, partial [Candidatus Azotimanducaceae bacterium]